MMPVITGMSYTLTKILSELIGELADIQFLFLSLYPDFEGQLGRENQRLAL